MTSESSRTPPRFVPTLTEVVHQGSATIAPVADMLSVQTVTAVAVPSGERALTAGVLEEEIVHRVMQRVDVVLEHRLREVITRVVQEQTRAIAPRLREEIELVVRQSVYEAVADELAEGVQRAPAGS